MSCRAAGRRPALLLAVSVLAGVAANAVTGGLAGAFELPVDTERSVVSVLPVWPDRPQGGPDVPPGLAPEGSGVVYAAGGWIVTAHHVVETALSIAVRLADGRYLPAELVAADPLTDVALLRVEADLPPIQAAAPPRLGQPVCALGNVYGLGLAQSCGVVSALHRSNGRFNPIEDFVQTDAAINPGSSGGALLDRGGRLVGLVSAIFAGGGDGNIGVNFALSQPLLARVADDLIAHGAVRPSDPGLSAVSAD
ncbi:MAG: trypsin-like peptidase domain-containing protein, partial [Tistlia sp.]